MHIKLANVSKQFSATTRDIAFSLWEILSGKVLEQNDNKIIAVDDVTLDIRAGEKVGIIGKNGAGKTTLLQMIAGLGTPTSGHIDVEGKVNCIMTLGIGLRDELTGRENIYLDGEINGKSIKEVDEVINDIIDFADIGAFIDYPLKTYSTGMKSRLAFAMIIFLEPEILIIDEALSAGDAEFSIKASRKMKEICKKGKILILVSHSMGTITEMCDRCIWLEKGRVIMDGIPDDVAQAYLDTVRKEDEKELKNRNTTIIRSLDKDFEITDLKFLDRSGNVRSIFNIKEELVIQIGIIFRKKLENPDLKISFLRNDGILLFENLASEDGLILNDCQGAMSFELSTGPILFGKNIYEVMIYLVDRNKPKDDNLLAFRKEVLKIENYDYPDENPVYYSQTLWR